MAVGSQGKKTGPGGAQSSGGSQKKSSDYGLQIKRGAHVAGGVPRLKSHCTDHVVGAYQKLHPQANVMQIPKLVKIVVNTCQSEATQNIKVLEAALGELELITGQKAVMTRAKKSIAAFKLRQGMPIGATVTLRKDRMFEFLDKLINVSLPRTRDFKGISPNSFDGKGNYSLGIKEQIIFPEIEADKVDKSRGLSITIVTSAQTDAQAYDFLKAIGMPFRTK
jgi:large subunit ribosomal protein L5